MSKNFSESDLKAAVDAVFTKYDTDKSGTLDVQEVTNLINDALKHMGSNRQATVQEVNNLIDAVDTSKDRKVDKNELLKIFVAVANQQK